MTPVSPLITDAENAAIAAADPLVVSGVNKLLAKANSSATTQADVDQFCLLGLKIASELTAPLASKALAWVASKLGITL